MTREPMWWHRTGFQSLIDGSAAGDASIRLAQAVRAQRELVAAELDDVASHPDAKCDRCGKPFLGDRHLLEITGHYVSGSNWVLCLDCTGDLYGWLGGEPDVIPHRPAPAPQPEPRRRHQ